MKKLILTIVFLSLSLKNSFGFDVVNLKNTKIQTNTKVFTKLLKNNDQIEGNLIGIAQIEAVDKNEKLAQENFKINITWNEYINKDGSKIELANNSLKSVVFSKTNVIKLKQKIKVQGNLSFLNQNTSNLQGKNHSKEETSKTTSFALPSSSSFSQAPLQENLGLLDTEIKTTNVSGVNCDANFNFESGKATIYVEEYYIKNDGNKLVTKSCYPSSEILVINYDACSFIHEFDKEQSWKQEKPYVNSSYGTKALNCMVKGSAIPHQYENNNCPVLTLENGIAMVQAKRFITLDNKNIYISDCEIVSKQGIQIDLRGCDISSYLVVESSYQVYPSGKRYVINNNQRVYIDSSCTKLLDYSKQWQTKFNHYVHVDGSLYSEEWHMYYHDFSEYEGGGVTDIKTHNSSKKHWYEYVKTFSVKGESCGKWYDNKKIYRYYDVYKRVNNTEYHKYKNHVCA